MDQIEFCKQRAVNGMELFLRNFGCVPDDKLNYKPTPTAKSALRIGAHTALYAGRFASMIVNRTTPQPDNLELWIANNNAEEEAVTTRDEVERIFREGTDEVLKALDTIKPEEIEMVVDSGQGWSIPLLQLMLLPGWHATLHTGQIDYLQTCWDDQEIYVG